MTLGLDPFQNIVAVQWAGITKLDFVNDRYVVRGRKQLKADVCDRPTLVGVGGLDLRGRAGEPTGQALTGTVDLTQATRVAGLKNKGAVTTDTPGALNEFSFLDGTVVVEFEWFDRTAAMESADPTLASGFYDGSPIYSYPESPLVYDNSWVAADYIVHSRRYAAITPPDPFLAGAVSEHALLAQGNEVKQSPAFEGHKLYGADDVDEWQPSSFGAFPADGWMRKATGSQAMPAFHPSGENTAAFGHASYTTTYDVRHQTDPLPGPDPWAGWEGPFTLHKRAVSYEYGGGSDTWNPFAGGAEPATADQFFTPFPIQYHLGPPPWEDNLPWGQSWRYFDAFDAYYVARARASLVGLSANDLAAAGPTGNNAEVTAPANAFSKADFRPGFLSGTDAPYGIVRAAIRWKQGTLTISVNGADPITTTKTTAFTLPRVPPLQANKQKYFNEATFQSSSSGRRSSWQGGWSFEFDAAAKIRCVWLLRDKHGYKPPQEDAKFKAWMKRASLVRPLPAKTASNWNRPPWG